MIRFNGNSILIVDADVTYSVHFKRVLEEKGAMVLLSHDIDDAKRILNSSDVDIIICSHNLGDASARDLFRWCKDSLSTIPALSAIGNCTELEKKLLEKIGVKNFFIKADPVTILEKISLALFDIEDFKRIYLESKNEKVLGIELRAGNHRVGAKAVEIMKDGIILITEMPFPLQIPTILEIKSSEDFNISSIIVTGMLQEESTSGLFFKVDLQFLPEWKKLLGEIQFKQNEVSDFLRRASGK